MNPYGSHSDPAAVLQRKQGLKGANPYTFRNIALLMSFLRQKFFRLYFSKFKIFPSFIFFPKFPQNFCKSTHTHFPSHFFEPLLLRSEISLFWRTSCARNFSVYISLNSKFSHLSFFSQFPQNFCKITHMHFPSHFFNFTLILLHNFSKIVSKFPLYFQEILIKKFFL